MVRHITRCTVAVLALIGSSSCGSDTPTAPSPPPIAQIAGVWRGTARTTSVTGGECVGSILQSAVGGTDSISASVSQSGASVTAAVTTLSSGGVVNYTGSVGASALQLSWTNCTSCNLVGIRCPNVAPRDIRLLNSSITGTVTGNAISGTEVDTYNVVVSSTGAGVGSMTINTSFTASRQ